MFDVGFSELVVIGVVALVVIGPERLPRVARTAGILVGRLQRYVAQVKGDISREIELSELSKVKGEFESAARGFQSEVQGKAAELEQEIREAQGAIERDLAAKADPAASDAADALPPPSPQMELGLAEQPGAPRDKAGG
jgi:sec-independent protein translocase protein TatB